MSLSARAYAHDDKKSDWDVGCIARGAVAFGTSVKQPSRDFCGCKNGNLLPFAEYKSSELQRPALNVDKCEVYTRRFIYNIGLNHLPWNFISQN